MTVQSFGSLNSAQQQAVELEVPIISIIAGPGTGKTTTLLHRLIHLVEQSNANPATIATLTFTQKAASELRERLAKLVTWSNKPFVGTFHGFAHQALRETGRELSIIPEPQRLQLIREIKEKTETRSERELSLLISRFKTGVNEVGEASTAKDLSALANAYQVSLRKLNKIDFDDLLVEFQAALQSSPELSHTFHNRFKVYLVDEFQDTSPLQYATLQQLLGPDASLCVIGDPRQSIYAFRGASAKVFDRLQQDYPQTITISLTGNYRSAPIIIDTAGRLFPQSPPLTAVLSHPGSVTLLETPTEWTEAEWVLQQIGQLIGGLDLTSAGEVRSLDGVQNNSDNQSARFSDFAVIFRSHRLARTLEKMFDDHGIPYQIVGGTSLYEKKEIQFLILILRYLAAIAQDKSAAIEQDKLEIKSAEAQDVWETLSAFPFIKPEKLRSLPAQLPGSLTTPVSQLVSEIIKICELEKILADKPRALKNLATFRSQLVRFDESPTSLTDCLNYFNYLAEHDYYDRAADRVTLLTMHAAKGLEFDQVFICGFEDGLIPHARSLAGCEESKNEKMAGKREKNKDNEAENKNEALAEERRLLYVALTRARRGLHLTVARQRFGKPATISRFWHELQHEGIGLAIDPAIAKSARRQEKMKKRQQQPSLF